MNDILFLTCWLTRKKCPQQGVNRPATYDQISKWYESIHNTNTRGIIIHDCFDADFIDKHTTDHVQFYKNTTTDQLTYSPNDSRYFLFSNYINNNIHDHVNKVFVTDIDVSIKQNFSHLVQQDKIYVGSESLYNSIEDQDWCKSSSGYTYCYPDFKHWHKPMLNCGILGGYISNVNSVIDMMVQEIARINPSEQELAQRGFIHAIDMPVFAQCVYTLFDDEYIMTGEPVCSRFTMYEDSRDDVWMVHK